MKYSGNEIMFKLMKSSCQKKKIIMFHSTYIVDFEHGIHGSFLDYDLLIVPVDKTLHVHCSCTSASLMFRMLSYVCG